MSRSYADKLKLPQWQEKRLRIMEHAGFRCEACGTAQVMLQVHHTYYEGGRDPWDYPDESLRCLCQPCHEQAQDLHTLLQRQLGKLGIGEHLKRLIGYASGLEAWENLDLLIDLFSWEILQGVADAWHINPWHLHDLEGSQVDGHTLYQRYRQWHPPKEPREE